MTFHLRYLARLREELECAEEQFESQRGTSTLEQLVGELGERGEKWQTALNDPSVMVAVNKVMVDRTSSIQSGDEIAFLPPVTGG